MSSKSYNTNNKIFRNSYSSTTAKKELNFAGYLKKKGAVNKQFKKRYFKLIGINLIYYKNKNSKKEIGEIHLKDCYIQSKSKNKRNNLFPFTITGYHLRRVFEFGCPTQNICDEWVSIISNQIEKDKKFRSYSTFIKQPSLDDEISNLKKCKIHKIEITRVCNDCSIEICETCFQNHKLHNVIKVRDLISKFKNIEIDEDLTKSINQLDDMINLLIEKKNNLLSFNDKLSNLKFKKEFDNYKKLNKYNKRLNQLSNINYSKLSSNLKDLSNDINKITFENKKMSQNDRDDDDKEEEDPNISRLIKSSRNNQSENDLHKGNIHKYEINDSDLESDLDTEV